jgi:hypothetical protein
MGITTKAHLPLVDDTTFNVPATDVGDGSNVYGTLVSAGASNWVAGNAMPKGRALLVVINTGALTGTPTHLRCGLYKGTNSSGASGALVTGTDHVIATPAGGTSYTYEIDLSKCTGLATDFYSLGLDANGGGSTAVLASATAVVLDPTYV